jgi:OPT family oligopeptide transporter
MQSQGSSRVVCSDPLCRHENDARSQFCARCGAALPPPTGQSQADEYQLPIEGFRGTPEEIERQWFEKCYKGRGDTMLQLTWRAIIMGSLLGGLLSLTNLYIGLKTGWGFGVAITACILSYAIWTSLRKLSGNRLSPMTVLENNCMQSTASSAGYSTGGTLVSAIAAYILINGHTIPTWTLMGWVFFLAVLGVTMAIPMKRQMINIEQLRFPSGVAAAETLRALHTTGGKGIQSAIALGIAGLLSAASKFLTDGLVRLSPRLADVQISSLVERFNLWAFGSQWVGRTVAFSWEPMFIAAGSITGVRACASMMLGGILCWMVFVPQLQRHGIDTGEGFREVVQWTLWGGAACMVTSGLLSFGLQWRAAVRAFRDLGKMFWRRRGGGRDDLEAIETPASWFIGGQLIGTVGLAYLAHTTFGMPYWLTVVAVLLSFALALVACRVCGETDTTPVGAMGKVTQLTFGLIAPRNMNINLMSACITAGAADSSSDLLTDLKSGYLLGANPRKQFIAQFAGIFLGTVVSVLTFNLVVSSPEILGSDKFPAPAAQTWAAVARALGEGLASLHPVKRYSILIGGLVGILLPLLSMAVPKKYRAWVPSPAGIGLAWTFNWYYSLLFFLGSIIGLVLEKTRPKLSEQYTFPVASGVIAGESLMGVALIFWEYGPEMFHSLLKGS